MSSMSTKGNTKDSTNQEIKPHILHNRMHPQLFTSNCTHSSSLMTQGSQDSQLLGHYGHGYNHLYPYWGAYGSYGLGYGYPYRGSCCAYRSYYPWFYF
jgi:hypothetical protein